MADSDVQQTQTQHQVQLVSLNFQNSGDPELEADILGRVHSAGRQLARLSSVVEVLIDALAGNPALAQPAALEAVTKFRDMQGDIARAKQRVDAAQFLARLDALKSEEPAAYQAAVVALRAYLDPAGQSGAP